ncbi:hypothetical protein DES49_1230 [Halospina denitrificans]|uniref:Uncharacterized protein n=1 Tax=Halospina denitrificans TaxID=332522 RepID=A0A4R7JZ78_9GAMM|nr:hypothetical protein [Halospina denitrificans]TDT43416.1 hypothetical protein DES49_1230 [Halospina denitrificans]
MTKDEARQLAERLLEQHVQHELEYFSRSRVLEDLGRDLDLLLEAADAVTLRQLVGPETIKAIISRHTAEREIPAIVPEMAAEFTNYLVSQPFHQQATPADIISRDRIEGFVDELLLLKEQREELIDRLLEQPVYKDLVAKLTFDAIVRYVYEENLFSRRVPGVSSALKFSSRMLNKAVSGLDEVWEKSIKSYIARNVEKFVKESADFLSEHLTDDELKTSIMDAWDSFSGKSLDTLQSGLGEVEWSEFVVMGYDFWLSFRQTEYFRHCYGTVVDRLFEQYGDYRLSTLLQEFNIDRDTVMTELEAILPDALEALHASGVVEAMLRRRLERFYTSDAALELLRKG